MIICIERDLNLTFERKRSLLIGMKTLLLIQSSSGHDNVIDFEDHTDALCRKCQCTT